MAITHSPNVKIRQPNEASNQWVAIISRYRKPEDIGVGDTAKRLFARLGGEAFKWLAKKIGMPCGCTERQAEWNRLWPY